MYPVLFPGCILLGSGVKKWLKIAQNDKAESLPLTNWWRLWSFLHKVQRIFVISAAAWWLDKLTLTQFHLGKIKALARIWLVLCKHTLAQKKQQKPRTSPKRHAETPARPELISAGKSERLWLNRHHLSTQLSEPNRLSQPCCPQQLICVGRWGAEVHFTDPCEEGGLCGVPAGNMRHSTSLGAGSCCAVTR